MHLALDVRVKVGLPLNAIGNLLDISSVSITSEDITNVSKLVSEMRKSIEVAYKRDNINDSLFVPLLLELAKSRQLYQNYGANTYQFTSLVKFPLHEIDFGWGKPTKVSVPNGLNCNWALLLSNQSGGLDAYVSLNEQEMSILERDSELLEFGSIVPSC
ncbi:acyltransferase Pun1-like [Lycium ferocissimum]|uniref:acyltransferase Pun1-like n=1 Tax=Lycium ferocissimum TaxID=112874 RepID=UPI002815B6A3|nr:acyltransferase Pun1-like [Lycium ferocissimum]